MSECRLLSIQEAADRLEIHRSTAYDLVKKGPPWGAKGHFPVPVVAVGNQYRVPSEVLEHFVRTGRLPDNWTGA